YDSGDGPVIQIALAPAVLTWTNQVIVPVGVNEKREAEVPRDCEPLPRKIEVLAKNDLYLVPLQEPPDHDMIQQHSKLPGHAVSHLPAEPATDHLLQIQERAVDGPCRDGARDRAG